MTHVVCIGSLYLFAFFFFFSRTIYAELTLLRRVTPVIGVVVML